MGLVVKKCRKCKKQIEEFDLYEYRGVISCENCFDDVCSYRDYEREQIIKEESKKTDVFRRLDMTDSVVGTANKKLLAGRVEVSRKESQRLKDYEGRLND